MARIIRNFAETLGLLSRGEFSDKCDQHLTDALETLEALPSGSGKATLTLTLAIAYDSGRVDLQPAIKVKLPEAKAFSGTPFWVAEGGLSTEHPSQASLFGPRETKPASSQSA